MTTDLANLRPLCMAVAASDFSRADRLKAIVQLSYEVLGASSITAYKYDRLSERLLIFAMPGVLEREIMRGPTPEPIFSWQEVSPSTPPQGIWLENSQEFDAYVRDLPKPVSTRRKPLGEDFRTRELRKHGSKGDLALAKIRLFKGEGQTLDRVGQIFFNFHKTRPEEETFTKELRLAIVFVAKLIRELLIEELYHAGRSQMESDRGPAGSLHLLRVIDEKLRPAVAVTLNTLHELDPDLFKLLCQHLSARVRDLEAEKDKAELPAFVRDIRSNTEKRLKALQERLAIRSASQAQPNEDLCQTLRAILPEALSRELWHLVCRAALEIVETYGGQADIILVLGDRIGKRVQPAHMGPKGESAYLWLHPQTVTGDCLERGKVFTCNNVLEKGSDESKQRFQAEPHIEQYSSLLVVPVTIEGEIRAVLRMMSTDKDCFLDRHTRAIEDMAFVTSYALNVLDSRQRRDHIADALAYFAEGQAVAEQASVEQLLKRSLRVLGAEFAVFWPVHAANGPDAHFDQGIVVNAFGSEAALHIEPEDAHLGIRPDGFTQKIFQLTSPFLGHFIFCHHVVEHLEAFGLQHPLDRSVKYVLQTFSERPCTWMEGSERTTEGFYRQSTDSTQHFPGCTEAIAHNSKPGAHLHSRIGFPVREKDTGRVSGIAWICFSDLHHLDWSERLFICALSNYLAQAMKADGLVLAIRSFRHMIPGKTGAALDTLKWAGQTLEFPVGSLRPDSLETAAAKATDVLFMARRKADEVNALLRGRPEFPLLPLQEIIARAWTIATDLDCACGPAALTPNGSYFLEEQNGLQIFYESEDIAHGKAFGALYTASVNILSNARLYGKEPFTVWVSRRSESIRVVFGNGGVPPDSSVVSSYGVRSSLDDEHHVGLAVVKKILDLVGGSLRLVLADEMQDYLQDAPAPVKRCKTLFEVALPMEKG